MNTEVIDPITRSTFSDRIAIEAGAIKVSYSELAHKVAATAELLRQGGWGDGHKVLLVADQTMETVVSLLAVWQLGGTAVLVNPKVPISRQEELAQSAGVSTWWKAPPDNDIACAARPQERMVSLNADATVIFTSGSSGRQKAAIHSYGNHYFSALGSNEFIALGPGDKWLLSLPLYHVGGVAILFRCFLAGATVVLPTREHLGKQVESAGITHLSCVPTQLIRLLGEQSNLITLKAVLLGGATIPPALVASAKKRGLPIYQTYGCTEMSSQVCTGTEVDNAGQILNYRELKISGDGEILLRGETLFRGYIDAGSLDSARDEDGWFHSGDLGKFEHDQLTVVGRKDNMFISGGENIQPEEIERELLAIDGVEQALVVPKADEEFGMRPVAFLGGEWEEVDVRAKLALRLPSYMMPVEFRDLPPHQTLKPSRPLLQGIVSE